MTPLGIVLYTSYASPEIACIAWCMLLKLPVLKTSTYILLAYVCNWS